MHEHGTKTTPVFLPADREASWLLLLILDSLLSGSTVQPESTCSFIVKITGQIWESQRRISINTNHSYLGVFQVRLDRDIPILSTSKFRAQIRYAWEKNFGESSRRYIV